jgi:hypothetical protein
MIYPIAEAINNVLDILIPTPDGKITKAEYYFRKGLELSENEKPVVLKADEFAKAHNKFGNTPISGNTNLNIMIMAGGNSIVEETYFDKATKAKQLIEYAMYWLTDLNALKLPIDCTQEEKEFINAIADYVAPEFGKIFEDADTINLDKYFSSNFYNPFYKGNYLLTETDIESYISIDFADQMRAKWSKLNQSPAPVEPRPEEIKYTGEETGTGPIPFGRVGRFDENGYYHPAFSFSSGEMEDVPVQPEGMDDKLFDRLELVFSNLIPEGRKHYYSYDINGNMLITTYSNLFDQISWLIDDGRIMGGTDIYICTNYVTTNGYTDDILINVIRHPDIAKRVLQVPMYIMNPNETFMVMNDMFRETRIYTNIDLGNTSFLDNLPPQDKAEFEKSCMYVFKILDQDGLSDTRLRITDYVSPFDFKLVSDKDCRISLPSDRKGIFENLIFHVDGSDVLKLINGKGYRYSAE